MANDMGADIIVAMNRQITVIHYVVICMIILLVVNLGFTVFLTAQSIEYHPVWNPKECKCGPSECAANGIATLIGCDRIPESQL